MNTNPTVLRLLIGARLLHVASPKYRRKKAERNARKVAEKVEMNELVKNEPPAFFLLLMCAICVLGIPFFLLYPGVSAWWSLACLLGTIVFFLMAVVAGDNSHSNRVAPKPEEPRGEMVNACDFLKKYKRFGAIPPEVEFDLVNRTSDYVFVSDNVISACIEAEQKVLNQ